MILFHLIAVDVELSIAYHVLNRWTVGHIWDCLASVLDGLISSLGLWLLNGSMR